MGKFHSSIPGRISKVPAESKSIKYSSTLRFPWACVALLVTFVSQEALAAAIVGKTKLARGTAAAQIEGQTPRILNKGAEIYENDVIQTGPASFVIVTLDGAPGITIRPNSKVSIDSQMAGGKQLTLHTGGVRGNGGKKSPKDRGAFKIRTAAATVNVVDSAAEFDVRFCGKECSAEEKSKPKARKQKFASVVGRVSTAKGKTRAVNELGAERVLRPGAPVHEKETVKTEPASHAVLVFRDASKITVEPDSDFIIRSQKFLSKDSNENEAHFELVKGGVRAQTGLIAQSNPDRFRISSPVATTGVRGTGFDLRYDEDGLYTNVWEGRIVQTNDAGTFELSNGKSGLIESLNSSLTTMTKIPTFMVQNLSPRPDSDRSDAKTMFEQESMEEEPPGLYVKVRSGHVRMENDEGEAIDLGSGETGYVKSSGDRMIRVDQPKAFIESDRAPDPEIDQKTQNQYKLIDDENFESPPSSECMCPS